MNQFGIAHDWPGLCALCHVEVAEFEGSHQSGVPIIARWKPTKGELLIGLDDGSKMRVTVCSYCEATFKPEDCGNLMKSVVGGWEKECEILVADPEKPEWDEARKKRHMADYVRLKVVDRHDTIWTKDDKKHISHKLKKEK